jgi:hypothetical protein
MNPKVLQIIGTSLIVVSLAGNIYSIVSDQYSVVFIALVPIGVALNTIAARKKPPAA